MRLTNNRSNGLVRGVNIRTIILVRFNTYRSNILERKAIFSYAV